MSLEFLGVVREMTDNGGENWQVFYVHKFAANKYPPPHWYWDSAHADSSDTLAFAFNKVLKNKILTFAKQSDQRVDNILKTARKSKDKTGQILEIYLSVRLYENTNNILKKTLYFLLPDVTWHGNRRIDKTNLSVWTIKLPTDDKAASLEVWDGGPPVT